MIVFKGQQQTIQKEFSLSGSGLHTGDAVRVVFKPAAENTGIRFVRVDLPGSPVFKADIDSIRIDASVPRCTTIGEGTCAIHTVEHLMSVLCGLSIDNLIVEINGREMPGLDGCGAELCQAFKKAGLAVQAAPRSCCEIREPLGLAFNGSSILIVPSDQLKISYTLDYPHPLLHSQFFSRAIDETVFENEIAPSRTFCLEEEAEELTKRGLGKGANYDNTLVVGKNGIMKNKLRFPDEFARHKVLDLMGDLYLLGMPLQGHIFAVKSGHTLNVELLKKIYHLLKNKKTRATVPFDPQVLNKEVDIQNIMKILPHRYPFLFLDRVIELEKGKRAVGIKNVTINDNFFPGHFPTRPVMPGVLMIEALAQAAGIAILTSEQHRGKEAFFMSVDKVKFRRVVIPGDQLRLEVEVVRDRSRTAQVRAVAKVDGEVAVEAQMMFSYAEGSFLNG